MTKKILIVDDDKDLTKSLSQILKTEGYTVVEAYNGSDGLKMMKDENPDLMILDVMMESDTAGFEVASAIRNPRDHSKYKEFKNLPIILLTAINQVTNSRFSLNEDSSFLREINEFCTKPIDPGDLLNKIEQHIN